MRNRVNCVKYYETERVLRKPRNTQQHVDEGIKKEFCENYLVKTTCLFACRWT